MSRRLAIAFLACLVASCAAEGPKDSCPADTGCNQPPPSSIKLAAELFPPPSTTLVRQEVASVEFDQAGAVTLTMVASTTIRGEIFGAKGEAVPAQVVVTRPSLIPGAPEVVVQATSQTQDMEGKLLDRARFSISVPRSDASYTITVFPQKPTDALYAPATRTFTADADRQFGISLGGPTGVASGVVLAADGAGLEGVRVVAVDGPTGAARSSVAITGPSGEFKLNLSPGLHTELGAKVRLVATPDPKTTSPTLQRDLGVQAAVKPAIEKCQSDIECQADPKMPPPPEEQLACIGNRCVVALRMPALPVARQFALPVGGKTAAGVDIDLVGARIDFKTDLSEPGSPTQAVFAVSVLSDDHGLASVDLIPGDLKSNRPYTVTVTPPASSMFTRTTTPLALGPAGGVLGTVSLALRPQLIGHLVGPSGMPVKNAVVSAQPAAAALNLGVERAIDLGAPMTLTGADGSFAVRVDKGSYDIELVPPAGEPLARWSIDNRAVSDSDVDLRTVPLPRAVLTRVTVLDPEGKPATGVEVRIYATAYADACAKGSCPLPARLRGQGLTRSDGVTPLLLPAP
ncbi:MAG: carboxypeptidase regulatory-like domain-containing protein [Myxococcales bacterium]|nr:carboxypeptidase regulatory-like domain-containing protein [Myxococcales bacterium]